MGAGTGPTGQPATVKPPGSTAPQRISKDTSLPLTCGALLTVVQSGSVQATFGTQGLCQLTQYEHQTASLVSRDPAGDLIRPNGKTLEVEPGQERAFDFSTGAFSRVPPRFSAQDLRVFRLQGAEMHLS